MSERVLTLTADIAYQNRHLGTVTTFTRQAACTQVLARLRPSLVFLFSQCTMISYTYFISPNCSSVCVPGVISPAPSKVEGARGRRRVQGRKADNRFNPFKHRTFKGYGAPIVCEAFYRSPRGHSQHNPRIAHREGDQLCEVLTRQNNVWAPQNTPIAALCDLCYMYMYMSASRLGSIEPGPIKQGCGSHPHLAPSTCTCTCNTACLKYA